MEDRKQAPHDDPLSPDMVKWLRLRRELEDRITDTETGNLFHEFMMVDLKLFEEESREAYERGLRARQD